MAKRDSTGDLRRSCTDQSIVSLLFVWFNSEKSNSRKTSGGRVQLTSQRHVESAVSGYPDISRIRFRSVQVAVFYFDDHLHLIVTILLVYYPCQGLLPIL